MLRRRPWIAAGLWAVLVLGSGVRVERALAGPAHYDKDTKSFRFTYTFADLPGGVGSVVGTVRKPAPDQEAAVKNLVGQVSNILAQVTDGRAKIGRLDYVDDIKNADLVVSLVGAPASPGWANMSSTEGRPGQIVLYYQSLQGKITQDIVFTAAHEICHYVFGLADEYNPANFPGGCPRSAGPGCLMDNYNAGARGFMGRLCIADHNVESTQAQSCKAIVDKFFSDLGVTQGDPPGSTVAAANATDPQTTTDNRALLIAAAIAQVRAKRMQDQQKGRTGTASLRSFARTTLRNLLDRFNADNPRKLILGAAENKVLDMIVKAGAIVPLAMPGGLEPVVFNMIKAEAERLGKDVLDVKQEGSRLSRIRSGLQKFVRELVKLKQIDPKGLAPADQRLMIDQLARDAARDPGQRQLDRLVGVGDRTAALELAMAEDIIRVLDALNEPGTPQRFEFLNRLRAELGNQFGIIGRDSSHFGYRRTQIVAPDSIAGPDLYILTQGGVFPYATVRDRSVIQFSRLINRSKIQLVMPTAAARPDFQPIAARIELPFGSIPTEDPTQRSAARVDIQQTLLEIVDQLQRDRLENIAILVPPGGLPSSVGQQIPVMRSRLRSNLDVRIDLVLAGAIDIANEVRDAVIDSHGSVLTVTDIDEIGAIAQRLRNEQSSGAWVVVPQPSSFAIVQNTLLEQPVQPPKTAADNIEGWFEQPKSEHAAVVRALEAARGLIDKTVAIKPDEKPKESSAIPQAVKEKADNATFILQTLETILGKGDPSAAGAAQAAPDSLLGQVKTIIDEAAQNEPGLLRLRGQTGLNTKLMATIGRAKDNLSRARTLLNAALTTVRTDPTSKQLNLLARVIQGADQIFASAASENAFRDALAADDQTLFNSNKEALKTVSTLGTGLSKLAGLIRGYERVLEAATVRAQDNVPIYKRMDRVELETQRLKFELSNMQRAGNPNIRMPMIPANSIRLSRFFAEGDGEIEMILGLSQELPASKDGSRKHPKLALVSDIGITLTDDTTMRPGWDDTVSTPSLLVWRITVPALNAGWYTPIVTFEKDVFDQLQTQQVDYTFSVGSDRPNIQLITGLVQNAGTNSSGTIVKGDGPAVVEVQVSAGSSVLGASIFGFYQKITKTSEPIGIQMCQFKDDGKDSQGHAPDDKERFDPKHCDRAANDGVYTAFVPLDGINQPTEIRVFVQADTTDGTARYIGLDDPSRGDEKTTASDRQTGDPAALVAQKKSTDSAEGQALRFQRATSVHFEAKP